MSMIAGKTVKSETIVRNAEGDATLLRIVFTDNTIFTVSVVSPREGSARLSAFIETGG